MSKGRPDFQFALFRRKSGESNIRNVNFLLYLPFFSEGEARHGMHIVINEKLRITIPAFSEK